MTDKKMYKLLERFANEHALAVGVKIGIYPHGTSFRAIDKIKGSKYEDINLLSDLIRGAESFLLWARRKRVKL